MTGATGLIGGALGQRLVRDGHQVRALVRKPEQTSLRFPGSLYAWDARDDAPAEAFENADAVIHLAGENIAGRRWTPARKQALHDSRVRGVESLQRGIALSKRNIKLFISASGVGYYGDRGEELLTEASPAGSDFLASLCQDWEAEALKVKADRIVLARFGVALSPHGGFLRQLTPMFQRFGASRIGSGRSWLSWIHIDDLVEALMWALKDDSLRGPINVVAPVPATNREVTATLRSTLATFSAPPVPELALRLLFGEMANMLLGSQRALPTQLESRGFNWRYRDFSSAVGAVLDGIKVGESQLVFEQWVAASPSQVWRFFSSERNLEQITPPFLSFQVLGKSTDEIGDGTTIDYRLKVHGLPVSWRTRISEWAESQRFVDQQIHGPYRTWNHTHEFEAFAGGTLVRDSIVLKPPMGWMGRAISLGLILRDVEAIFKFRSETINVIFSQKVSPA